MVTIKVTAEYADKTTRLCAIICTCVYAWFLCHCFTQQIGMWQSPWHKTVLKLFIIFMSVQMHF